MNILNSIIFGIVEGLTEFLPISSTAHLIITSKLLHLTQTEFLQLFEIFIQSGAILAVIFIFFKYVFKNRDLWPKIIISFLPTGIIGFLLEKIIKHYFFNSLLLIESSMFIIGVGFIIFEYLVKKEKLSLKKSISQMSYSQAFLIGLGQSLAVVPGVSRSGIVMLFMMGQKFKREEAAMYSFLLAVPTIFAASGYELMKTDLRVIMENNNLLPLLVGFIVSFLAAYLCIRWFINFLKSRSLTVFGLYRVVLSIILYFMI